MFNGLQLDRWHPGREGLEAHFWVKAFSRVRYDPVLDSELR